MKVFDAWKASIEQREGTFTPAEREKMFLSLRHIKDSRYQSTPILKLLSSFFLKDSSMYSQSISCRMSSRIILAIKELRGRSDNPFAEQFSYNYLTIAVKRDIAPSVSGNTGSPYSKAKWYTVSDEPVKKRQKKK